jgi:hypothetical protein
MDRRAYLTAKKRESRERARGAGKCIICTTNPATAGLVTCQPCRAYNSESRRQRAKLSKPQLAAV